MAQNLKLGDNITSVKWNGWTIRGKDTSSTIVEMIAKLNLSYRQIAKVFDVSYQTICNRVQKFQKDYPELWLEIESKKQFYETFKKLYYENDTKLAPIAKSLDISINKCRMLEREIIPKSERRKRLSIEAKQNSICHALFGYEYNAGRLFAQSLKQWFKKVDKEARERLTSYYLDSIETDLKARFERAKDIDLVRQYVIKSNFNIENLIENEVICKNRRMS